MSDDVKRYEPSMFAMHGSFSGQWVRYEDYDRLRAKLEKIRAVVDEQAKDADLWFSTQLATEAHLQIALYRLHIEIKEIS